MSATQQDTWSLEDDQVATASLEEAQAHDAFWAQAHAQENYFRAGLDYEDYAPAYCVGYVGHAQYGGDFDDAEKSMLSNWVRIKGDSRLSLDEARMCMRAAWDRAEAVAAEQPQLHVDTYPQPWAQALGRILQGANDWLDRVLGERPAPMRPVARRTQQSSLLRQ